MKTSLTLFCLLVLTNLTFAQKKYEGEKLATIQLLESKRKEFQTTPNDSIYLVNNSDKGYSKTTVTRGDQAEDIETQIFGTKLNQVAGPFDGETSFYLLKVIAMDSLKRTQAKLVSFFPKGECITDSTKFNTLVDSYVAAISKGKVITKMLVKDEASIGIKNKGIISFWENQSSKENFTAIFDKKLNESVVTKTGKEIQVLYVVEEKQNAPYKAKVLKLVKNIK